MKSVESLLEQSKQPYLYLIETIRDKDSQVNNLREELATLRRDVEGLRTERQRLVSVKNQMALDLEKLLSHNEVRVTLYCTADSINIFFIAGAPKNETVDIS